ncbi:MAG: hypothetical protein ACOC8H_01960 [bacterium]
MSQRIARLLALFLVSSGICFAFGSFLFNYNLYRFVPTSLCSNTMQLGGDRSLTAPGFLDIYLSTVVWAAVAFVGLYAFLILPASPRLPKQGGLRQLARLVGLVMILVGAFVSLALFADEALGLLGVLAVLLGIVPFLCLPMRRAKCEQ